MKALDPGSRGFVLISMGMRSYVPAEDFQHLLDHVALAVMRRWRMSENEKFHAKGNLRSHPAR